MKSIIKSAALIAAFAILPLEASAGNKAGQRYATPPPVTLSPDLSSAWTLQITPRKASRSDKWKAKRPHGLKRLKQRAYRPVKPSRKAASKIHRTGVTTAALQRRNKKPLQSAKTEFPPEMLPTIISYSGNASPGTIIVNTSERRLYLVMPGGKARRYAIGVGRPGFEWSGTNKVSRKAKWPDWRPPASMIRRERKKGIILPKFMKGGMKNPLGARALYLGSTIYRIHGTYQTWSIGKAVSSGCIRMRNEDVMDLYERVPVGAKVKVI